MLTSTACASAKQNSGSSLIENGSADITRLEIIHGFNGGTVLQSLVRSGLESKRIKEIRPGDNSGQTIIILKQGEK